MYGKQYGYDSGTAVKSYGSDLISGIHGSGKNSRIAKKYLLPNAMSVMGLKKQNLKVTDDAMREIINEYTMESGVRGLKKQMETLCRQAAVKLVKGEQKSISVGVKRLKEFLGRKKIHHDVRMQEPQAGVVTGLAWTSAGGEILFIETSRTKGEGKFRLPVSWGM